MKKKVDLKQDRGIIPRKIKGFRDIDESLNQLRWRVINAASKVYRSYGFEHLDTPVLEYADCLGKYLPDRDTVDEGVYSFKNPEQEPVLGKSGKELRDEWDKVIIENHYLSLRYDLTAPLARVYAERLWNSYIQGNLKEGSTELFRRYQFGPVYRFEKKVEAGRFREFWQLDFDSVGTKDMAADAEVCMILSDALETIGLKRGSYVVNVNNRKILKGFLQSVGIIDSTTEGDVLRILDKVEKIGIAGMIQELGDGRIDEQSGSKIAGLGLNKNDNIQFDRLIDSLGIFYDKFDGPKKRVEVLEALGSFVNMPETFNQGLMELSQIDSVLTSLNFREDRVIFSPTLVRGLAYYTGPVFEVESLQPYKDEKGVERKFGSICGGGRYDGLVERLLGIEVPATGASIGVDRLCALLKITQQEDLTQSVIGPILIVNFSDDLMGHYQKIAREIRAAGIDCEVYMGTQKGLKKQMAYADKRNSPFCILLGEDELKKGVVTVRDLNLGKDIAGDFIDKAEWMKTSQFEIKNADLVDKLHSLLSQYR